MAAAVERAAGSAAVEVAMGSAVVERVAGSAAVEVAGKGSASADSAAGSVAWGRVRRAGRRLSLALCRSDGVCSLRGARELPATCMTI